MARADLHNALVLDREIYDASQVDPTLLDPHVEHFPVDAKLVSLLRTADGFHVEDGPQGDRGPRRPEVVLAARRALEVAGPFGRGT
jgi:hypothetical protein